MPQHLENFAASSGRRRRRLLRPAERCGVDENGAGSDRCKYEPQKRLHGSNEIEISHGRGRLQAR